MLVRKKTTQMKRTLIIILVGMLATQTLSAQQDTTTQTHDLKQVVVKATKIGRAHV